MPRPTIRMNLGEIRELTEEEREQHSPFKYVVCAECKCNFDGKEIIVPQGFLTDGSSGGPDVGWSWLIHDYLYATHQYADGTPCARIEADIIMYCLLRYERHRIYASLYWMATFILWWKFSRAWRRSGELGALTMDCGHDH